MEQQVFYDNAIIPPPSSKHALEEKRYIRLVIDSKDRDLKRFPSPQNYEVELYDDVEDVVMAQLLTSYIPLSGYVINTYHNTIYFVIGSTQYAAILSSGDYDAASLATEIASKMTTAAGRTFTTTYSASTGKITIGTNTAFSLLFSSDNNNSISRILGFLPNATYTSSSNSIVAPYKVNLDYFKYIVMNIRNFDANVSSSSILNKSFAILPNSAGNMNTNDFTEIAKRFNPPLARINKINISFTDRDGFPYDFNGVDHIFELMLISYKQKRKYMNLLVNR